ncbi:hypothetical protein [Roseibium sediminis]|uniref:hypothetical protein n=1 Tax=Roseibium sediminis TaxID=1775174 RepID=UPI00123D1D6B|nr:hypothetical protein [Roseibium sediminis]
MPASSYTALRQDIRSGDLIAFRGNGPVSRLIRHVTGGRHTHVGVAFWWWHRLFVLEAREGDGVRLRACSARLPFDWIATGLNWTEAAEQFAADTLDDPYSYLDAVRAGLGLKLRSDGFICSEYAAGIQMRCKGTGCASLPVGHPSGLVDYWLDLGRPLRSLS